jgi:putative glycosyltransferase (TIGR04348 family)
MARIAIVTPARAGSRTGNRYTAARWARMLRAAGHRVAVLTQWRGEPCDLLVALHARRSFDSVERYRAAHPAAPLAVVLTGTDLYRDLPASAEARRSLELGNRIVVLQDEALSRLAPRLRRKAAVVYQSADPAVRHAPPARAFRVAVLGHLREEKDPFRAADALAHLSADVEVLQLGAALSPDMAREARRRMAREPRYRWLGSVPHARALTLLAKSHLLVVSSRMEGGANVIAEAARIGTPVLASRVPGNVGMLGRGYPGYFPLGNERALARCIARVRRNPDYHFQLRSSLRARRKLFAPAAERAALLRALGPLLRPRARGSSTSARPDPADRAPARRTRR